MTRPLSDLRDEMRAIVAGRDDAAIEARLREGSPDKARHITIGDDFPEQVSDAAIYTGFAVLFVGVGLTLWGVL